MNVEVAMATTKVVVTLSILQVSGLILSGCKINGTNPSMIYFNTLIY